MNAIERYRLYSESDDEFSNVLRMEFEWYDDKYQEMISLVKDVFYEFKEDDVLPKDIIYFFTVLIDFIFGTISREVFFTTAPAGESLEGYKRKVLKRKSELLELKKMFYAGNFSKLSSHSFFI